MKRKAQSESALWKEATRAAKAWVDNWATTLYGVDRARVIHVFRAGYIRGKASLSE